MASATRTATTGDEVEALRRRARRRLLGAGILIAAAIIVVPVFLEREPPPLPDDLDVRIPPVDGTRFEPRLAAGQGHLPPASRKASDPPMIQEPAVERATAGATTATLPRSSNGPDVTSNQVPAVPASQEPKTPSPAKEASTAAASAGSASPARVAPSTTPPASRPTTATNGEPPRRAGQLVVQIIAVRDAAAAKAVADRARGLKYPVYTERIDVANGVVTRVRVGPFDTRQAAEAARAKLARDGFEPKVLTLQ